jgi:hypothetical protein
MGKYQLLYHSRDISPPETKVVNQDPSNKNGDKGLMNFGQRQRLRLQIS